MAQRKTTKDEKESNLRSGGVENTKPDEALRGQAENDRLQRHPPPLVHVDPTTGKPISQPLDESKEANQSTVPGDGGVKDARPNNGQSQR